jgi:hypothetical protein
MIPNGLIDELYAERGNRDARYQELKAKGLQLKRYSIRGQQLHPMYVQDRNQRLTEEDRGFGNTVYKTYFAVLYGVREAVTTGQPAGTEKENI